MKKLCALILALILTASTANAYIFNEDFERRDFGDFTMLVPVDWEYGDNSTANQIWYFCSDVHKMSGGLLMIWINEPTDIDLSTEEKYVERYSRILFDWGVYEYFYHDFYVDDCYSWFWSGELETDKSTKKYMSCGFCTYHNNKDYFILLLNENSNGLNNSWRLNTMIDSIEWTDTE